MKKLILYFILLSATNCLYAGTYKSISANWFPATNTDFPLKNQSGADSKLKFRYALAAIAPDCAYFIGEFPGADLYNPSTTSFIKIKESNKSYYEYNIQARYNIGGFPTYEEKKNQFPIILIDSKDIISEDAYPPYYSFSITPQNTFEYDDYPVNNRFGCSQDNQFVISLREHQNKMSKVRFVWESFDHCTLWCGELKLKYTTINEKNGFYFVSPETEGYDVTLMMNKIAIPWEPGFNKQQPKVQLETILEKDGMLEDIKNTFYVLADNKPTTLYLGGSLDQWMHEQARMSIAPKNDYPDLVYKISDTFDFPAYQLFTFTPKVSNIGKSYTFYFNREADLDYNDREAITASELEMTFKIIDRSSITWAYGNEKANEGKLTIEYNPSYEPESILKLAYSDELQQNIISTETPNPEESDENDNEDPNFIGFTKIENLGYTFINNPIWSFSDASQTKSRTLQSITPGNEALNVLGTTAPVELTIKPYKPTLHIEEISLPHQKEYVWDDDFIIYIPKEVFEAGNEWDDHQYARLLLIPQFETFPHEEAATEYYGSAPLQGGTDSWLCHNWYKQNGHEGFLPLTKWNPYTEEYECLITPDNMTMIGWDGIRDEGHSLVSGHYRAQIIPSFDPDSYQYGVVASDPVDLYIYPSFNDMKFNLCVRDSKDAEPYWKDYDVTKQYGEYTVTGPTNNEHGAVAYGNARLTAGTDYAEVWVENQYHKPGEAVEPKKNAHRTAASTALDGYTKLGENDLIDLTNSNKLNIKLVKNGAVTPEPMTLNISKTGQGVITGITGVIADGAEQQEAEYFTPAGVKIGKPTEAGIYIERRGAKCRRITIR